MVSISVVKRCSSHKAFPLMDVIDIRAPSTASRIDSTVSGISVKDSKMQRKHFMVGPLAN